MIEAFNNNFRFSNFNEKAIHDGELSFDSLSYSMQYVSMLTERFYTWYKGKLLLNFDSEKFFAITVRY